MQLSELMRFICICLTAVLVLAGCGGEKVSETQTQGSPAGLLSQERVDALKQKYTAPDGKSYEFSSSFIVDHDISPGQRESLKKDGKVPYGFICELDEVKVVDGETLKNMCQGRIKFYILDSEGKVAQSEKTQSLAQMCAH